MAKFWKAESVSVSNGGTFVTVNTGDDVALIRPNSLLQISAQQMVETKAVNTSNQTIELFEPWEGGGVTGQPAIAAPTAAELAAAIDDVRRLTTIYEGFADNLGGLLTSTDPTIEIGNDEVVPWGYINDQIQAQRDEFQTELELLKSTRIFALAGVALS